MIVAVAEEIHRRLVTHFRNTAFQYWIGHLSPNDAANYQYLLQTEWSGMWLDSKNEWRRFRVADVQHIVFSDAVHVDRPVNRQMWKEISAHINENRRTPIWVELLANSLQQLHEFNGRLATLEAVAALEAAEKQILPKLIHEVQGWPEINESGLDRLVEKAGLRIVTEVGLKLIGARVGLQDDDVERSIEAVETRNQLVHGNKRTVPIEQARNHVATIKAVIGTLEGKLMELIPAGHARCAGYHRRVVSLGSTDYGIVEVSQPQYSVIWRSHADQERSTKERVRQDGDA